MRAVIISVLTLAYPLLVYLGLGHFEPRWLALMLAGVALARAYATRERVWLAAAAGALLLAAASALGNQALPLKLYPVLVSTVLLVVFATSLFYPPSVIERLARLREPDLPPEGVAYTRRVTQVWCGFFVINGSIALYTALWASDAAWALYNGLISYGLMGALFAGEWLVRRRVKARLAHG
ncbi:COG4648 family protein [Chitinimonas naiadis]